MTSLHSALSGENIHLPFPYITDSDPGAVGAGKFWLDTSTDPNLIFRRNDTDDDWIAVGGSGGGGGSILDGAKATRNTNQSIPDATPTEFVWASNFYDQVGDYLSGTNTQLILANGVSGIFAVYAQVRWGASALGTRTLRIIKNGTDIFAEKVLPNPQGDDDMDIYTTLVMANGDFVELQFEQDSGGALDIVQADLFTPMFAIHRMGNQ